MALLLLTDDDRKHLEFCRLWNRGRGNYQTLHKQPVSSDYVFILERTPTFIRTRQIKEKTFVTLDQVTEACARDVGNASIYEAWLDNTLYNIKSLGMQCLDDLDARRLVTYFKSLHDIQDESELARDANEAVVEAHEALYGKRTDHL